MTGHLESTARKLSSAWETFWYSKGSTFNLGLFRILFAISLYVEVSTTTWYSVFAIEGGFHLPYVWFIQPVTRETFGWLLNLQFPFILLLALGLLTRLSCSALLLLQGYVFFADQMNFRNHPYFFLLVLFVLLFSPADDALSLKSILRALKNRRPVIASLLGSQQPLTFQRLIQVQVCIVYLYSAFQKLNFGFLGGTVLEVYMKNEFLRGRVGKILPAVLSENTLFTLMDFLYSGQTFMVISLISVILEFGLPLALWFRKTRPFALILGIGFHIGLLVAMDVVTFSLAMIATYLLFLEPQTLVSRLRPILLRDRAEGETLNRPIEIGFRASDK